jgi:hypothetical protein
VGGRQTNVDDGDVQRIAADLPEQLVGVTALGDDIETGVRKQAAQAFPQ